MRKIILSSSLLLWMFLAFPTQAQTRRLNENFNKIESPADFPPYGWIRSGKGLWDIASPEDGYNKTPGAISNSSSLFGTVNPNAWLISPRLIVQNATDSLKFKIASWVDMYEGFVYPESYMVRISTTGNKMADFKDTLIRYTFTDADTDWKKMAFSLEKYIGQEIYIAFIHNTKGDELVLRLDDIEGPAILDYQNEIAISSYISPQDAGCDISNIAVEVILDNIGKKDVENLIIHSQIAVSKGENKWELKDLITDTIPRVISSGDTIHYTFSKPHYYSDYQGSVMTRTWITFEQDEYQSNDTLFMVTDIQKSKEFPIKTSFEETVDLEGWAFTKSNKSFGWDIGVNPDFAYEGTQYGTVAVYHGGDPYDGSADYIATPCLYLEKGKSYQMSFHYKFRLNDSCSFRILLGKEQHELADGGRIVTERKSYKDREGYAFFLSDSISVEESGTYYIGLVVYNTIANSEKDNWHMFVDAITVDETANMHYTDLKVDEFITPYDCALSSEEEVMLVYSNQATLPIAGFKAGYQIDAGERVEEVVADTIFSGEQKVYIFKTKADFSKEGDYTIKTWVSAEGDVNTNNDNKDAYGENRPILSLPFVESFETYSAAEQFWNLWKLTPLDPTAKKGFMLADDFSEGGDLTHSGSVFLAHGQIEYPFDVNDWAISPCVRLEKDTTYQVAFWYRVFEKSNESNKLRLVLLDSYEYQDEVEEVLSFENIENSEYAYAIAKIKPTESKIYHFGFNIINKAYGADIFIDDFRVSDNYFVKNDKDQMASDLHVYPNPVSEMLNVGFTKKINTLRLYNTLGVCVYKNTSVEGQSISIPVSHLKSGMYLLQAETESGPQTRKIAIK